MGFCTLHRQTRFALERKLVCVLIWRKIGIRYYQWNSIEMHIYREGGIIVSAKNLPGAQGNLHVCHGGMQTAVSYKDEIFGSIYHITWSCYFLWIRLNEFILILMPDCTELGRLWILWRSRFGANGMISSIFVIVIYRASLGLPGRTGN